MFVCRASERSQKDSGLMAFGKACIIILYLVPAASGTSSKTIDYSSTLLIAFNVSGHFGDP
jgi:hypothetical protein